MRQKEHGAGEIAGADEVIDYTRQDFTKMNRKFDVVFDAVGKSSFGKCKPLIGRSYPLERIADAYRYVETRQKTGNVIITMDNE